MALCTNLNFGWYDTNGDRWWDSESFSMFGWSSYDYWAAGCIKFTTPSVIPSGLYDKLIISLKTDSRSTSSSITVDYAICKSSVNLEDYDSLSGSLPSDSTRIYSGRLTFNGSNSWNEFSIPLKELNFGSNTSYYIIFKSTVNETGIAYITSESYIECYERTATIVYDANGGSGEPSTVVVDRSDDIFISNIIPIKSNSSKSSTFTITGNANSGDSNTSVTATKNTSIEYEFLGWSTNKSATSAAYHPGDEIYPTVGTTTTLYAIWEESETTSYSNNTLNDLPIPTKSLSGTDTYTVTLDAGLGSVDPSEYKVGKSGGYKFSGWASTSSSKTPLDNNTSYTSATTVYAIWDDSSITDSSINLPTPTREDEINVGKITLKYKDNVTNDGSISYNKTTKYTFLGWGESSTATTYVSSPYTPTKDITLYARWTSSSTVEKVNLPTPTRDTEIETANVELKYQDNVTANKKIPYTRTTTYTFKGWGESSTATSGVSSPYKPTWGYTGLVTLYAIWSSSSTVEKVSLPTPTRNSDAITRFVTLKYQDNGITDDKIHKVDETTKYTFLGWGESSTATTYVSSPYKPTWGITGYVVLYAIWKTTTTKGSLTLPSSHTRADDVITRSVTLNYNNNKTASETRKVNETTSYTLDGWGTTESVKSYSAGASYTPTSDTTLYAIWKSSTTKGSTTLPSPTKDSVTETYVVTLNPNKGTVSPTSFNYTKSATYTFNGWYTDDNVKVSSPYTPTASSTTLSAVWNESSSSSDPIQLPEAKREGYEFQGWGKSATSAPVSNSYIPTESITLYAIWELGGIVHIGNKSGLILIYHDGSWCQAIPNLYNNGDFRICI